MVLVTFTLITQIYFIIDVKCLLTFRCKMSIIYLATFVKFICTLKEKHKMKRVITVIIAMVMCLELCACGEKSNTENENNPAETTNESHTEATETRGKRTFGNRTGRDQV